MQGNMYTHTHTHHAHTHTHTHHAHIHTHTHTHTHTLTVVWARFNAGYAFVLFMVTVRYPVYSDKLNQFS